MLTFPGFFGDLQDFVNWGHILNVDFLHVYSVAGHPSPLHPYGFPPAFPPMGLYLFGLSVRAYLALQGPLGWPDTLQVAHSPQLATLMKIPSILADCAIGVIVYRLGSEARGGAWGLLLAALWMFSPVGIFDGALWGQTDLLPVPFVLLALILVARQRHVAAGLFLGLALAFKPQALIFVPLVLFYVGRWNRITGLWRTLGAAAGVTLVVWLPYLGKQVAAYQDNVQQTLVLQPNITASAFNLWWLLGMGSRASTEPLLGQVSLSTVAWILLLLAATVVLLRVSRTPAEGELLMGAAILGLAFFVVSPLQHERYIAPAIPLFLAAAASSTWGLGWYVAVSVAGFLNLALWALHSLRPGDQIAGISAYLGDAPVLWLVVALAMVLTLALLLERAAQPPRAIADG